MYNQQSNPLWHAVGSSRMFESSGSRSSFQNRWNPEPIYTPHLQNEQAGWLEITMQALQDEEKKRWLNAITNMATRGNQGNTWQQD